MQTLTVKEIVWPTSFFFFKMTFDHPGWSTDFSEMFIKLPNAWLLPENALSFLSSEVKPKQKPGFSILFDLQEFIHSRTHTTIFPENIYSKCQITFWYWHSRVLWSALSKAYGRDKPLENHWTMRTVFLVVPNGFLSVCTIFKEHFFVALFPLK